jgi:H+/Cl- antiporter ClcA
VFGTLAGILTALLWGLLWWVDVAREYAATPTGSHELWFALWFDIGGALFLGFVVIWLFRRRANWLRSEAPPAISPVDVARFVHELWMPDRPKNAHLTPSAIGFEMMVEDLKLTARRWLRRARRICR